MKKFPLSITSFSLPSPRQGSIDVFSGFGRGALDGIEIHQRLQARRLLDFPEYKPEMWMSRCFEKGGYSFDIGGRADGLFPGSSPKIEEIKSSFNIIELEKKLRESEYNHPYCLQLKTYGYFYWLNYGVIPELNLVLVSSRDEDEMIEIPLTLNTQSYEEWLELRLSELVQEAQWVEKLIKRRKKSSKNLKFPFENARPGQSELINSIEEGLGENRPLLVQAPTGLGKTMGVLYPSLKEALARGQKVVYVTPKNSQHSVAENAVEHLQETGAQIRSLTLTAKSKMCMKSEPLCNPEYCEYAKNYYTKVAENKLVEVLSKKRNLQARTFKKLGEQYQVCPFELQMEATQSVDAVICDYNYVFSPNASSARLAGGVFQPKSKPNLIIDEAHNLPSRARDYFSPQLSISVIEDLQRNLNNFPKNFISEFRELLEEALLLIKNCGEAVREPCKINLEMEAFFEYDQKIKNFLSRYLKSPIEILSGDPVMKFSFYWGDFVASLETVALNPSEFFITFHPSPATLKITCCDASVLIADRYEDYSQVVAFSATLKPFNYYQKMMGLSDKNVKLQEFNSPFPKSNRKLLFIPQISSKYSQREKNYPRIAETIQKIIALKPGNYFAFFPSFDFMEKVLRVFQPPAGFGILKQERSMRKNQVDAILEKLAENNSPQMVFAVQGGIFSEGIDYPGKMAIGAFVIGPPLPVFNLENEKLREYFEENYSAGFDYTYTYPAMAKSIQAAGRVIRSETDQGLIVFMDDRFLNPSFAQSMPTDWFEESPHELTSQNILAEVAQFWDESHL